MIDKPNFGLLKKHLPSSRFLLNRFYTKGLRHGRCFANTSLTPPVTPQAQNNASIKSSKFYY